ncbi:MAG: hypothetical protein QXI12_13445, partial [Candidatus Methanomethyliaceae archaeon]
MAIRCDPDKHHRHSIRLQVGAYFVTVCTKDRACLFGEILDDGMRMNPLGELCVRNGCDRQRYAMKSVWNPINSWSYPTTY